MLMMLAFKCRQRTETWSAQGGAGLLEVAVCGAARCVWKAALEVRLAAV